MNFGGLPWHSRPLAMMESTPVPSWHHQGKTAFSGKARLSANPVTADRLQTPGQQRIPICRTRKESETTSRFRTSMPSELLRSYLNTITSSQADIELLSNNLPVIRFPVCVLARYLNAGRKTKDRKMKASDSEGKSRSLIRRAGIGNLCLARPAMTRLPRSRRRVSLTACD